MQAETVNRIDSRTKIVVAGLMLTIFLVALDGTIVSTAMPSIVGNLGGFSLYAWVPSVYLLTQAVSTPIYGKLSDLFGRKRVLFFGIGAFLLGSVTSGAAQSMGMLILFRAIQGLGAGALFPVTITIVGDLFSLEQRARIQGVFSSVWGVSALVGPLLGGGLVDHVGWRWIFYLNLPVGLPAVIILWLFFHEERHIRRHALDIAGAVLLTSGLSAVLLLLLEGGQAWGWVSVQSALLAIVTGMSLGLFVFVEQRAPEPVIPLNLFRLRIVAVSSVAALFAGMVMMSVSFAVPLFVQGVLGKDAFTAGLALAPMTIGWPLAGSMSGRLAIRFGYRATASAGMLFVVLGMGLLSLLHQSSSFWVVGLDSFVVGVGLGLSSTPMIIAVQSAVAWAQRGAATGTNLFVRTFGSVVGLAVMGAIINHATGVYGGSAATNQSLDVHQRHAVPPRLLQEIHAALFNGIHGAFVASLVAGILGLLVVVNLPGGSAMDHQYREPEPEPAREVREA
ncbi:MAG TPA: MDR family MFS transporter [Chloroflexota bacterium]